MVGLAIHFWSKMQYGNAFLSSLSERIENQVISFMYQSVKTLLELKPNVKKEDLLEFGLGITGAQFLQLMKKKICA